MPSVDLHTDVLIHRIRKKADEYEFMIFEMPDHSENRHVDTPNLLVNIPGLTTSNLEKAKDCAPCIKYLYDIRRNINPDASGSFQGAGSYELSNLLIIIPFEPYITDILNDQFSGKPIDEMTVKTVHWTGEFEVLKEEKFSHCNVIEVTHSRYWTLITFHVRKVEITIYQYNQATGVKEGQNATVFNFIEDVPE
jgi:hypothetical protein